MLTKMPYEEFMQLQDIVRELHEDDEYVLDESRVMLCRGYISDGPGFIGDIAIIVGGEPEYLLQCYRRQGEPWRADRVIDDTDGASI